MEVNLAAATTTTAATAVAATSTAASATSSAASVAAATELPATSSASSKTLKRCLSVPIIRSLPPSTANVNVATGAVTTTSSSMTTRSAAAAAAAAAYKTTTTPGSTLLETPKKYQTENGAQHVNHFSGINIGVPHSNPCSREVSPAPVFNIFAPRARRYSASYSPLSAAGSTTAAAAAAAGNAGAALRLTPRVSQLRKEECVDMNSREVNHEREVHSAMQMSQSWEDLTLVAENWSCKSDEFSNPLQVALPSGATSCSSPSPTSNRAGLRLPYGLSPSPTRRTFATRRSMSPIAMRPSQLGPVKRKFELDDNNCSNWNVYSPPPLKKMTTESRGSSPVCQSPSSVCPSPDSGTYDGRITPKLFISKLCTTNTNSSSTSACSSPMSAQPNNLAAVDTSSSTSATHCSSSSSSSSYASSCISGGSEPMCIGSTIDEGISITEAADDKTRCSSSSQRMSTDVQDEATLMDDMKSETSSIGGCSSISVESTSCDSGAKTAASILHRFMLDDGVATAAVTAGSVNKNFFINKQGLSGAKKFIVNHDNLPNSSSSSSAFSSSNMEQLDGMAVSSTTGASSRRAAQMTDAAPLEHKM